MDKCKHKYTQWKGEIKTCLFCSEIVDFKDMLNTITFPNGHVEYFNKESKLKDNNLLEELK